MYDAVAAAALSPSALVFLFYYFSTFSPLAISRTSCTGVTPSPQVYRPLSRESEHDATNGGRVPCLVKLGQHGERLSSAAAAAEQRIPPQIFHHRLVLVDHLPGVEIRRRRSGAYVWSLGYSFDLRLD